MTVCNGIEWFVIKRVVRADQDQDWYNGPVNDERGRNFQSLHILLNKHFLTAHHKRYIKKICIGGCYFFNNTADFFWFK